jgi:hypothetical protein
MGDTAPPHALTLIYTFEKLLRKEDDALDQIEF